MLLDTLCPKCGVLCGKDHRGRKIEFDERPHVCRGEPFQQQKALI